MDNFNSVYNDRNNKFKSELGRNVFIARKSLNLNHMDLFKLTGLTRPILSTIENSTANPTLNSIMKLATILEISNMMLIMTQNNFTNLHNLLKKEYAKYLLNESELYISDENWKLLKKYSDTRSKSYISKLAKICTLIINLNFSTEPKYRKQNMILGATLGIIFQEDGFNNGLQFGAWLGNNLQI